MNTSRKQTIHPRRHPAMRNPGRVLFGRSRRGAAFLLLVLMVLVVVTAATGQLVRRELATRRGEADRLRTRTMLAAIEAVRQSDLPTTQSVRLPLGDAAQSGTTQSIEVTVDESAARITARWYRGDKIVDTMSQTIEMKTEPQP